MITYEAGIYAWGSDQRSILKMMTPQPPAIFHVNGMRVGCTAYDALKEGTLECLFDPICLNLTIQWISNLPINVWPKSLNISIPSRFSIKSTVAVLLENFMVEQWITIQNFSKYYIACDPLQCTYTITHYYDFIYVITLLIGLYGGLTVVLRILTPLIIRISRNIYVYFMIRRDPLFQQIQQGNHIIKIQTFPNKNIEFCTVFFRRTPCSNRSIINSNENKYYLIESLQSKFNKHET